MHCFSVVPLAPVCNEPSMHRNRRFGISGAVLAGLTIGGLNNQREAVLNAVLAAMLRNVTLVLPGVFLIYHRFQEPIPHEYEAPWTSYIGTRGHSSPNQGFWPATFDALFDKPSFLKFAESKGLKVVEGKAMAPTMRLRMGYHFSTCVRFYDCCMRLPHCLEVQRLLRPASIIADTATTIRNAVRKKSGCYIGVHLRFWHKCDTSVKAWGASPKQRDLAKHMAEGPLKVIMDQKLNEKCDVVYLISEVTWPELRAEFESKNLTVFWKQNVVPGIEERWPFEALSSVDWQMAVESDYYVMMPKGKSSFDLFTIMHRRFRQAPVFQFDNNKWECS